MVVEILGFIAAACIISSSAPQLFAVLKGSSEGVSVPTWSMLMLTNLVWLVYGIKVASASITVGNFIGVLSFGTLVVVLLFQRYGMSRAVAVVPIALAILALLLVLPTAVSGVLGVVFGVTLALPQLKSSFHTFRFRMSSNVALGSWLLVALGQSLWLCYGIAQSDAALIVTNIIGATISLSVISLEILARKSEPLIVADATSAGSIDALSSMLQPVPAPTFDDVDLTDSRDGAVDTERDNEDERDEERVSVTVR